MLTWFDLLMTYVEKVSFKGLISLQVFRFACEIWWFVYSMFLVFVCTCKSIQKLINCPKHYNLAQVMPNSKIIIWLLTRKTLHAIFN
jgi:hypothetical protein